MLLARATVRLHGWRFPLTTTWSGRRRHGVLQVMVPETRGLPFWRSALAWPWEAGLAGTSAWRVNDVVAYDLMRESATTLTSLLLQPTDSDSSVSDAAREEAVHLRRDVLHVDGFDRAAVTALSARIDARIRELSGAST